MIEWKRWRETAVRLGSGLITLVICAVVTGIAVLVWAFPPASLVEWAGLPGWTMWVTPTVGTLVWSYIIGWYLSLPVGRSR